MNSDNYKAGCVAVVRVQTPPDNAAAMASRMFPSFGQSRTGVALRAA
jgi:hypothetical protein